MFALGSAAVAGPHMPDHRSLTDRLRLEVSGLAQHPDPIILCSAKKEPIARDMMVLMTLIMQAPSLPTRRLGRQMSVSGSDESAGP